MLQGNMLNDTAPQEHKSVRINGSYEPSGPARYTRMWRVAAVCGAVFLTGTMFFAIGWATMIATTR